MTTDVRTLKARDSVFAVCADTTWEAAFVRDYLDANADRARNGVAIKRIFYEFSGRVIDAAQEQAAAGMSALAWRRSSGIDSR
jgi:hypothetical protein